MLSGRASISLVQASAETQRPATPAYTPPENYEQLRADCTDDSDAQRQIAGCNAVLAHPGERDNHATARNNRGQAQERSGDLAGALADYERAIAIDATYTEAKIRRARALARLGRTDEALAALDQIIGAGDNGWARLERGRVHARRMDFDRASQDFAEAIRLQPGDPEPVDARDWAHVQRLWLLDFDALPPSPATLAEAMLSAEAFSGLLTAENVQAMQRVSATRVRLDHPSLRTGGPGRFEVDAPNCSEVRVSEFELEAGGEREVQRRVVDVARLRGLLAWQSGGFVYEPGTYGERTVWDRRGPIRVPIETKPGGVPENDTAFAQALVYRDAIRRFCLDGAAGSAPVGPTAGPTPTREVRVTRGLMRDKPFSLTYPADLSAQTITGSADLVLMDASAQFEVHFEVRPATPGQSAARDERDFGDGSQFAELQRRSWPGSRVVASALVQLPSGPAFVIRSSDDSLSVISATFYDGGRLYQFSFIAPMQDYDRYRETIGFILANFAASSAARPCCAPAAALP